MKGQKHVFEGDVNLENKNCWDTNANFWDERMGDKGNQWHLELIAPSSIELLGLLKENHLLDIGCGNGLFARRMAEDGMKVTAIDFAAQNIDNAKKYNTNNIDYKVMDATNYDDLLTLGKEQFDAACAHMVLMDIPAIEPMFKALTKLLKPKGCFVFSINHPCFHSAENSELKEDSINMKNYVQNETYKGEAINGQPSMQFYFHRTISDYIKTAVKFGFVLDGMEEPVFEEYKVKVFEKVPPVIIMRFRLLN